MSVGAVGVPTAIYYAAGRFSKGKALASEYSVPDPYIPNISFPNKEILSSGNEASGIINNKVWLGVWEESESNNKRIFEGVELKYNQDSGSQLCLGEPMPGTEGAASNRNSCSDIDNVMEVKKNV